MIFSHFIREMLLLFFISILIEIFHCFPANDQHNDISKRKRRSISDSEWEDSDRLVGGWTCQRCTLVNGTNDTRCRMCQFENLPINGNNQKVPSHNDQFGIGPEWTCQICDQLNPSDTVNCCWCDAECFPVYEQPNTPPVDDDHNGTIWMCSKCDQMNPEEMINCVWCEVEAFTGENNNTAENILDTQWKCIKKKCGITLPYTPPDARCPSCNKKSLARMDHANISARRIRNCFLVEEKNSMKHSNAYIDIMQGYRNTHETFVDNSFPHSTNSIGDMVQKTLHEEDNIVIEWRRPHQIRTDDYNTSWSVFNDPQPTDISQGLIGNCWFVSSLAVVAERPDILEKLFVTKEYNPSGVYELRLCIDGIWQHILVDDYFPCRAHSHTMVFATGRKNQLWVSLVEKALAKAYGNYSFLKGGWTYEGLATLTGWPILSFYVDEYKELDPGDPELDLFWTRLSSAREARFLIACSTGSRRDRTLSKESEAEEYRRIGLLASHGYSILDVRQVSHGERLLQVRNPWGYEAWLGEFGQQWAGWTPQLEQELANEASNLPGTFWIPFHRFIEYFDEVDIAEIREHQGWRATRYNVNIGWQSGQTIAIRLVITDRTEICATLFQHNSRSKTDNVDIMLLLHKQKGKNKNKPGNLLSRSPHKISPFVRTDDIFLGPGDYLLYAHSFSKFGDQQMVSGTIVIHSSKSILSKLVPVSLDNLQKSLVAMILKEGKVTYSYNGSIIRHLDHRQNFTGMILMVDNNNPDSFFQSFHHWIIRRKYSIGTFGQTTHQHGIFLVHLDCQESMNVISTRNSLIMADSIPPLHRQIVTILTKFEYSQSWLGTYEMKLEFANSPNLHDLAPKSEFYHFQNYPAIDGGPLEALHGPILI